MRALERFWESLRCGRPLTFPEVVWGRCAAPCRWCSYMEKWHRENFKASRTQDGPYRSSHVVLDVL